MGVDFQTIVVGGGVIGLAIAEALAAQGSGGSDPGVLLIERNVRLGQETSSRSSEVVHAGLYYPPGSLKARLCVEGRGRLKTLSAEAGIPYRPLGKLVVACSDDEIPALERLAANARLNGVMDLRLLSRAEALALEPALECRAALLSPSTSVVDSTGLMLTLEARYVDRGGTLATGTNVVAIERHAGHFRLVTISHGCETLITCRSLILSAGLSASALSSLVTPPLNRPPPRTTFAKGHYFALRGRPPFERLIYPMPTTAGLGIHFTLSTAGEAKFGPDVHWCEKADPTFETDVDARRQSFAEAIRRYWPAVEESALSPAYAGVRPKLARLGSPAQDFMIEGPDDHGCDGLIALYGMESPGLTSSLAIADLIASRLACTTPTL